MTNQQRLLVAIVFVVAVVGGGLVAFTVIGGGGAGASPSPIAAASASATAGIATEPPGESAAASQAPSEAPPSTEPSESVAPSASASVEPSATPRPTPAPGKPATIVFTALKLDARDDPDGKNRRFDFESQGSGTITVAVRSLSPQGNAIVCLSADGTRLSCKTSANGKITARTTKRKVSFVLTVRGEGIATPVVDITITFPARDPSIRIRNARFDGTAYPDTNGIAAVVTPRADGDVALDADWGGHPFLYEVDLLEQGGPGTQVLPNQGPATRVSERIGVVAPNRWKLLLQNIEGGFGPTALDATIAWP
jgi:hypothetical protein